MGKSRDIPNHENHDFLTHHNNSQGSFEYIKEPSKRSLMTRKHHLKAPETFLGTLIFDLCHQRQTGAGPCFNDKLRLWIQNRNKNLPR